MKVAIVYDRVNKWGGAERVLLALHEIFPDAPLFTAVYDENKAPWAKVFIKVIPSFLNNIPILKNYHELLGWLTPIAFEQFDFSDFDLVISVTSEAAKGVITKPGTKHICYCLTPTRYLWSGYKEYLNNVPKKLSWIPFYKILSRPFLSYAKMWDKVAANRPDEIIAISTAVQKRIKKYYKRNSKIIYPPVNVEKFNRKKDKKQGDYYLVVNRLVPYKKVDLVVEAFNELGHRLVIVGTGSEEKMLKNMAKSNITFVSNLTDEELASYYQGAVGFIYPQEEDFGITVVEAQSTGLPVIAYRAGGALDTMKEDITGIFFDVQDKKGLISAVKMFERKTFKVSAIKKNAERFSKEKFEKEFVKYVGK